MPLTSCILLGEFRSRAADLLQFGRGRAADLMHF